MRQLITSFVSFALLVAMFGLADILVVELRHSLGATVWSASDQNTVTAPMPVTVSALQPL